jgi:hypothetical protein
MTKHINQITDKHVKEERRLAEEVARLQGEVNDAKGIR